MIAYFDTSALVPLLIDEPATPACRRFWDDADDVVSCRLLYVEAAAAIAQAHWTARIDEARHELARSELDAYWNEMDVVEVDEDLMRSAADLARREALRGYDSMRCAAAARLLDDDLVAASGDARLLTAWRSIGVATFDVHEQG